MNEKETKADWLRSEIEKLEEELEIQKAIQEKSKEVVVFGRARVAGMVADKYTRIGKIEVLTSIITRYKDELKELESIDAGVDVHGDTPKHEHDYQNLYPTGKRVCIECGEPDIPKQEIDDCYDTFIRSALNAGFTDPQVNWLEKYIYDDRKQ